MSHRLEKEMDTKYHDYKEPRTSRRRVTGDYRKRQQNSRPDIQSEDAETIWNIARESESSKNRSSFADEQQSVENITKQYKKLRDNSNPKEEQK